MAWWARKFYRQRAVHPGYLGIKERGSRHRADNGQRIVLEKECIGRSGKRIPNARTKYLEIKKLKEFIG